MPLILLTTSISAPIARCFDLSRSIDLHLQSTAQTNEKAIAGVTTGLIGLNEQVTWQAKHFGITQRLTSFISAFNPPYYFERTMLKGAFKKVKHKHIFEKRGENTVMLDEFYFEAPWGLLGQFVCQIILTKHLKHLLEERNRCIKQVAESDEWIKILNK